MEHAVAKDVQKEKIEKKIIKGVTSSGKKGPIINRKIIYTDGKRIV